MFNLGDEAISSAVPEATTDAVRGSNDANKSQASQAAASTPPIQVPLTNQPSSSAKPIGKSTLPKPPNQPNTSTGPPGKMFSMVELGHMYIT